MIDVNGVTVSHSMYDYLYKQITQRRNRYPSTDLKLLARELGCPLKVVEYLWAGKIGLQAPVHRKVRNALHD